MNNLDTWKYLQANNYFKNHNCYKKFQLAKEDPKLIEKIKGKIMVEIGCGYGRETYYFSKHARNIYAIDVSNHILELTKEIVKKHGKFDKVQYILAEEYKKYIKEPIDFIYSKHVFQHIPYIVAEDYLEYFRYLFRNNYGEIDILFRIGNKKRFPDFKEPLFEYTEKEISCLLENFYIFDIEKQKDKNYELWRIHANVNQSM